VYPAVTVLEALELEPDTVLWVGGQGGMEEALVNRLNIPFKAIPAAGLHGVGFRKLPGNLWKLLKGFLASIKILRDFKPDVLLFTGGYVAFPMAVAGLSRQSLLYVPDIEPGLALKALARFADRIALTTESSRDYFRNPAKISVTGYPTRPGLQEWTREKALDYFNFDSGLPTLAVSGGSKGARSINYALLDILPELLEEMQIVHLTGHLDWDVVEARIKTLPAEKARRYQAFPYLHEMGAALAAADLIVSRAGASVLGEYPLFALPAILVPYPYAWRYQKVNASYLVDQGAAVMVKDENLKQDLLGEIRSLMHNPPRLAAMREAMAALATPEAAQKIAGLIREMADETGEMK
jgi:UDP-N-acetylglucosamine--N-acetylmuramyl-(pentapeptide) pyrophosphoryl-undecaprenol N-acetylglucosamine transferase